jgi:hypothetical protein
MLHAVLLAATIVAAAPAAAERSSPELVVGGVSLPMLSRRPERDGVYVVRASAPLEAEYRARLLPGVPWALPIAAVRRSNEAVVLEFDSSRLPPFLPKRLEFRKLAAPGLYAVGEGQLMMEPEHAAALDLVVNECRSAKRPEFSFE